MANYREPQWLLPNEKNLAMPASDATVGSGLAEDRQSLYSIGSFDGVDDYIDLGSSSTVADGGQFSMSFWVKLETDSPSTKYIFSSDGSYNQNFYWIVKDGDFRWMNINGVNYNLSTTLTLSNWHHILVIFNPDGAPSTIRCFTDGANEVNVTTDWRYAPGGSYEGPLRYIGGRAPSSGYGFIGALDEFAVWDNDQSANVSNIYNSGAPGNLMALGDKPMAYYPLGEQARLGSEWQFPNEVLQSQVFDFDGSTDFIDVDTISLGNTFTLSCWVNFDSFSATTGIIFGGGVSYYALYMPNSTTVWAYFGAGSSFTVPALSGWNNLIFTRNGATGELFLNGQSQGTNATYGTNDFDLKFIGCENQGGGTRYYLDGKLSNAAVWNTVLDSANIANIYNNGSPQSSYTTTPTAWYKLNATSNYAGLNPNFHNALDFVSSENDYISFSSSSLPTGTTSRSVSAWFKADSTGQNNEQGIFRYGTVSTGQLFMMSLKNGSGCLRFSGYSADIDFESGIDLRDNTWHHAAMVYNGTTVTAYLDGSIYGTPGSVTLNTVDTGTGYIGNWYIEGGAGYTFNGELSNIAFYTQEISAEDVIYLYNGGTPQTSLSFEPTSWWKLDNLTTGIEDSGSASNNGTNNGTTAVSSSVAVDQWNFDNVSQAQTPNWSSALFFDGTNDYIDCGNDSSLQISQNISISVWFRCTDQGIIFAKGQYAGETAAAGFNYSLSVRSPGYGLAWQWYTTSSDGSSTGNRIYYLATTGKALTVIDGLWHNIVVTRSASSSKLYLDGEYIASTGNTATDLDYMVNSSQNVRIGDASNGADPFPGDISNVQVWNTQLTDADALSIYNNGQPSTTAVGSPQAWWKLDSTTITDSSGNGNTGTNNGATEIQTNVWTPRLNGESTTLPSTALVSSDLQFESPYSNFSLDFDGTNNYINIPNNSMFDFGTNDFTWSLWINYETHVNYAGLLYTGITNNEYRLKFQTSGQILFLQNGDGDSQVADLGTDITGTGWHHLCLVRSSGTITTYLDGSAVDTDSRTGNVNSNGNDLYIGRNGADYFDGKMDEIAIWDSALTQAQVSQVHNNGYPADLTSLSPTSWWRLGEDAWWNGADFIIPNQITGAPNGTSDNMDQSDLVADAPGSYASGIGNSLVVGDRVGDAPESTANSLSFNMTPLNKISYPSGYVPTQVDNVYSMVFDGSSDYVDIGSTSSILQPLTVGSISMWWKPVDATPASSGSLFSLASTTVSNDYFTIWNLTTGKLYVQLKDNGTNYWALETDAAAFSDNTWAHIVITQNGTEPELYVNGVKPAQTFTASTNKTKWWDDITIEEVNIGAMTYTGGSTIGYANGNIDEVAIFNYGLSARQIKQDIYEGTTTGKTADLNNISNLTAPVAWYRMGD